MPMLPWIGCALLLLAVFLFHWFSPEVREKRWTARELEWRRRCWALGVRPPKLPLSKQPDLVYDGTQETFTERDE